jgi:hypothetical protein
MVSTNPELAMYRITPKAGVGAGAAAPGSGGSSRGSGGRPSGGPGPLSLSRVGPGGAHIPPAPPSARPGLRSHGRAAAAAAAAAAGGTPPSASGGGSGGAAAPPVPVLGSATAAVPTASAGATSGSGSAGALDSRRPAVPKLEFGFRFGAPGAFGGAGGEPSPGLLVEDVGSDLLDLNFTDVAGYFQLETPLFTPSLLSNGDLPASTRHVGLSGAALVGASTGAGGGAGAAGGGGGAGAGVGPGVGFAPRRSPRTITPVASAGLGALPLGGVGQGGGVPSGRGPSPRPSPRLVTNGGTLAPSGAALPAAGAGPAAGTGTTATNGSGRAVGSSAGGGGGGVPPAAVGGARAAKVPQRFRFDEFDPDVDAAAASTAGTPAVVVTAATAGVAPASVPVPLAASNLLSPGTVQAAMDSMPQSAAALEAWLEGGPPTGR